MIAPRSTPYRPGRFSIVIGVLLSVCAALWITPPAGAALTDAQQLLILEEAQNAFDEGVRLLRAEPAAAKSAFREAADRYRQLLDDGIRGGALHYNLANACVRAGDVGEAILHYRIAQHSMPGDERIAHNLAYARSLRRTRIDAAGEQALRSALFGWHETTAARTKFTIFLITYTLFWLVMMVRLGRRSTLMIWLAVLATGIWLPLGASLAVDALDIGRTEQGVLLRDDVIVRMGNGEGFEPQFEQPLHQGVEFEVIERRGDWLNILLPDGKDGWVPSAAAGITTSTNIDMEPGVL